MKKKITLKRIFHRDAERIAICFSYDENLRLLVKKIPGVQYTSTHKCFYTDYSEENLGIIKKVLQDDAELVTEWQYEKSEPVEKKATQIITENKSSPENFTPPAKQRKGAVEMRINESTGHLVIRLPIPFSSEWVDELKSYHGSRYDNGRREWLLPWSKLTSDSLADYFGRQGVDLDIKKEKVDEELKLERKKVGDEIRERPLSTKALDGLKKMAMHLDENRYSARTRESYLAMMEFFFRYFSDRDPEEISEKEMSGFIYDVIIKPGYSAAYQNQMI